MVAVQNIISILIADHSMANLAMLGKSLKSGGYKVLTATTGKQAIAIVKDKKPDLVLMEMSLSDPDCYTVCQSIKKSQNPEEPLVIVKGIANSSNDMERIFALGADDFISNARNLEEILTRVKRVLSSKGKDGLPVEGQKEASNKILLVEDNELNQIYLSAVIEDLGFIPEITDNGLKAFDGIKSGNYCMVITDVNIAGISGIELTKKIRADLSKTLPIIGISGHSEKELIDTCLASGMNEYLTKPFKRWVLKTLIRKYLSLPAILEAPIDFSENEKSIEYNYTSALRLAKGNTSLFEKWLTLFLSEIKHTRISLQDLDSKIELVLKDGFFHNLVNYSGYFGASELATYIEELRAIREFSTDPDRIKNFIKKIDNELKKLENFYSSLAS